jgi:hypothetical protein
LQDPPKFTQIWIFGLKNTIWQPWCSFNGRLLVFLLKKSLSLPREDFRDFFVGSEPAIKKHRCQHCHRVLFQLEANFFVTFSPTSS